MIGNGNVTWTGMKGDVVCRPSDWKDVLKFFLVNYGLHAFTVITEPGSGAILTVSVCVLAILFPYYSLMMAIECMTDFAMNGKNSLEQAKLASALIMVIPKAGSYQDWFEPAFYNIHGHHPFPVSRFPNMFSKAFWLSRASRDNGGALGDPEDTCGVRFGNTYQFADVPVAYKVQPLANRIQHEFELASTYGVVKTLAALIQLGYSSYELYAARANQFEKYGYGAYSLTIIPYVLMSMLNLAAFVSRPSYSSKYIVYYRGFDIPEAPSTELEAITIADTASTAEEGSLLLVDGKDRDHREAWMKEVESMVTGHVGYAYGDPSRSASKDEYSGLRWTAVYILLLIVISLPYILIYALTGFTKRENTVWQRSWFLSALVCGQVFPFLHPFVDDCIEDFTQKFISLEIHPLLIFSLSTLLLSVPTVGMFVTVARTIFQDQICTKI